MKTAISNRCRLEPNGSSPPPTQVERRSGTHAGEDRRQETQDGRRKTDARETALIGQVETQAETERILMSNLRQILLREIRIPSAMRLRPEAGGAPAVPSRNLEQAKEIDPLVSLASSVKRPRAIRSRRGEGRTEGGYALVGIMGVMLFSLVLTTATAPKIHQDIQREKEEEMLWRGQQVATGLTRYASSRNGQYPLSLNELVQGVEQASRRLRFMRPSALCDPMMPCEPGKSNWRMVHPGDPLVRELLEAYTKTLRQGLKPLPPPPAALVAFAQMSGGANGDGSASGSSGSSDFGTSMAGTPGLDPNSRTFTPPDPMPSAPGQTGNNGTRGALGFDRDQDQRPIIGVVSRKKERMFRSYFGIEFYDHSLFFATVPVMAGGFASPLALEAITGGALPPPKCEGGGVLIDGRCWGGLTPGILCRGPNGQTTPCPR